MNGTPRLRSAFPQTPPPTQHRRRERDRDRTPVTPLRSKLKSPDVSKPIMTVRQEAGGPLIPLNVIDAPSQRMYVLAAYGLLIIWRFYDSMGEIDDLDSTWLFLKWNFIDASFLFTIQAMRIPWMEWTFPTFLTIFLLHAAANTFIMFKIPFPLLSWLGAFIRMINDRELSILERSVKPAEIIHNSSLILGRQIIHILPEGSAVLNPDRTSYCLSPQQQSVALPIRINQTTPVLMELLRVDVDTGLNETIVINNKQLKSMRKQAEKRHNGELYRDLLFTVKKPGIYRLQKVVDESNLEVRTRLSDVLIALCPKAVVKSTHADKCKGELSDVYLEVEGVPPLKIKYSRRVNGLEGGVSFQNVHLENSRSPLVNQKHSGLLIHPDYSDLSWAQPQRLQIPLNESLSTGGEWVYAIEEVHDAYGNVANYSSMIDEIDRTATKQPVQSHQFTVHERPRLSFTGCNAETSLEVAKGDSIELPLKFHPATRNYDGDGPFEITYSYSESNTPQDAGSPSKARRASLKSFNNKPRVKEPGWYSITGVSSRFCQGEVLEPSSCFMYNPPEPELSVRSEKVFDKCANNPVGLVVYLDLVGSPPFRVRYTVESDKGTETHSKVVHGLRGQLDLTPSEAGRYRYRFLDVSDNVYGPRSLKDKVPLLEQDVKPPASAQFWGWSSSKTREACFGESVSTQVMFAGEGPWTLQYELVHNGKRTKRELTSQSEFAEITTEPLQSGGEYVLSLTSVTDQSKCKRPLQDSLRIDVRSKKPHAAFGMIEEKRKISALEGSKVNLPVRLSGQAPWLVKYRNVDAGASGAAEKMIWDQNGFIPVSQAGRYEITNVVDTSCPGIVDQSANTFEVSWIPRPNISMPSDLAVPGKPNTFEKEDICQGEDDTVEVKLSGRPPFNIKYEQYRKNDQGTSVRVQTLKSSSHVANLEMDTSQAGKYSYKILELSDGLYDHDPKSHKALVLSQTVHGLPSARFDAPGRVYAFCKEDGDGDELIPITLEGKPPFSLEVHIKHHSSAKEEVIPISSINTNKLKLPIPRKHLDLGQHVVSIRRVKDARKCQRIYDHDAPSVRVAVSDVPTIIPLESQTDYCVGDRLSFSLSGHAPFEVFYTFENTQRRATSAGTTFRRIAEKPGQFTITAVSDSASGKCKAHKNITKIIHPMPSVRVSKGRESVVDIHEGGEAELQFEFGGTPPFEFTYTRSSIPRKGKKPEILDIKHDISYDYTKTIKTSDEGTYEVVAIKDKYCSYSTQKTAKQKN